VQSRAYLVPIAAVGLLFLAVVIFPVFAGARIYSGPGCYGSIRALTHSLAVYAQDNNQTMPPADRWTEVLLSAGQSDRILHDPRDVPKGSFGYAMRDSASEAKLSQFGEPAHFAMFFDSSDLGPNANGSLKLLPSPGRHGGRNTIGYLDGHAKSLPMP